jgi:hypothetical protein
MTDGENSIDEEFAYAALLEKARALPPMTAEQRIEQKISFAWGNAAVNWPTPPPMTLEAFTAQVWKTEWKRLRETLEAVLKVDPVITKTPLTDIRKLAEEALR